MDNNIEQGVLVVDAYANDERDVSRSIQDNVSKAIKQLNEEGKRIINISTGPQVKYLLGMNHITYLLWEKHNTYNITNTIPQSEDTPNSPENAPDDTNDIRYDVKMVSCGKNKLGVISELRSMYNYSLSEASKIIDKENVIIKENTYLRDARYILAAFEAVGAKMTIQKHR